MYILCFTIKQNKIAIKFKDSYKLIDGKEITYNKSQNDKAIHLVSLSKEIVPVFKIDEDDDVTNKGIVLIQTNEIFGVFVNNIDDIIRSKLPKGYKFISKEEFEILVKTYHDDKKT